MNLIQFITTKQFLKHFALLLLITLLLTWITLMLLKQYTRHGSSMVVPTFVGMQVSEIDKMESSSDFEIAVVDSVYDYTNKGGIVVSQDPLPDSKVKPGRTIYLSVVSFLPEQVKMPALVDLSFRQAKALLQTYGLKLGNVSIIPDIAKNAVLQVSVHGRGIQPGKMIAKGSMVDISIGSGSGGTESLIPFLIGKSRAEAIALIMRSGLVLGNESYNGYSDSLNAKVYDQSPMYVYGKKISNGTTISLIYHSGETFDFESYIQTLQIDTIRNDSIGK